MRKTIVLKDLSYKIVGLLYEVHRTLGRFCRERQYGDSFEKLLIREKMEFIREYPIEIAGRKSNFVDFFIDGKLLLEIKAKPYLTKEDYFQMKRYLEATGIELGLLVNFRNIYLKPRRVLNAKLKHS